MQNTNMRMPVTLGQATLPQDHGQAPRSGLREGPFSLTTNECGTYVSRLNRRIHLRGVCLVRAHTEYLHRRVCYRTVGAHAA